MVYIGLSRSFSGPKREYRGPSFESQIEQAKYFDFKDKYLSHKSLDFFECEYELRRQEFYICILAVRQFAPSLSLV